MKKTLPIIAILALFGPCLMATDVLNTANTSLVLNIEKGKPLSQLYYGSQLKESEVKVLRSAGNRAEQCYPAHGLANREDALCVKFPDGNITLDLRVEKATRSNWEDGEILAIVSRDQYYPLTVTSYYKSYYNENVISTWTEISNEGKKSVELSRFDSGSLPFRYVDTWITTFHGSWANECRVSEEPLSYGMKSVRNQNGVRNSQESHAEAMISLDGKPNENYGRTIGAALCYSGNYELRFNRTDDNYCRFFAGICPDNSHYTLAAKETFATPELALSFSTEGLGGVSRNFHRWGRNHKIAHGNTPRKVLLNSWEGTYFNITEPIMDNMMSDIASMGGELFVMDDGWFGDKYPRKNDQTSLGDWVVDREKLPHGIGWLVKQAESHGIKFGIWIEPEMTNCKSELYEKHPDWVVKAANRPTQYGRGGTQLVLDLSNPKVQDFVFSVVDDLMRQNPGIDYIKWDANMSIHEQGSQYLDNQEHLFIEYHKGLAKTLDRIRAKYPDVTIQACASGGGRANYGVLPWFDEFWVSDNIDAVQRLNMQWGTSYFFPAISMASHIAASPNHTTGRVVPIKFRIDVAMSGRLGMEIQPKNMSEDEKDLCRRAIADYKMIRPVVQLGDLYRLNGPEDNDGVTSEIFCSPDKSEAVFFWWHPISYHGEVLPRIAMAGLDPNANYKVTELHNIDGPRSFEGKIFSGRFLMENGLEIPSYKSDNHQMASYSSRVLHLVKQ